MGSSQLIVREMRGFLVPPFSVATCTRLLITVQVLTSDECQKQRYAKYLRVSTKFANHNGLRPTLRRPTPHDASSRDPMQILFGGHPCGSSAAPPARRTTKMWVPLSLIQSSSLWKCPSITTFDWMHNICLPIRMSKLDTNKFFVFSSPPLELAKERCL